MLKIRTGQAPNLRWDQIKNMSDKQIEEFNNSFMKTEWIEEMTTKEQMMKQIEGRIETMQTMMIECIEIIYNAGYNDAIEEAYKIASETTEYASEILKLRK